MQIIYLHLGLVNNLINTPNASEMNLKSIVTICLLTANCIVFSQTEFPPLSGKGTISQIVGDTKIEVEYERPSARNRTIFGGLVPWNEVWRTGAGYCTKISFDQPVRVGNQAVPAGKYALFTIPNIDEWVVILNSDTTLYGSYDYDHTKDVARFVVKSSQSDRYFETLTIDIDLVPNNAVVYISWLNTQIQFIVQTDVDVRMMKYIKNDLLTGKEDDADQYGMGADYLLYQNTNYEDALTLANKMIEKEGNEGWARMIRLAIYERLHLYPAALNEIEEGLAHTRTMKFEHEKYRQREIEEWEKRAAAIKSKMKGIGIIPTSEENFDWLIGQWQRTNDGAGKQTFEQWSKINESEYVGLGCTLQGVDTVFKENIKLIKSKDGWHLHVLQKNAASPTTFVVTKMDASSFVCENAENDFPKMIHYTFAGDKMIATISGGGNEIPFTFERVSEK